MSEPFVGPNGYIWVQILVPRVRVVKVVKNDVILVDKLDKGDGHGHVLDYGTVYRAIFTPCQAIHVRHCSSMVTRLGSKRGPLHDCRFDRCEVGDVVKYRRRPWVDDHCDTNVVGIDPFVLATDVN